MEIEHRTSFTRDLRQIRSAELRQRVIRRIEELEAASAINEVSGVRASDEEEDAALSRTMTEGLTSEPASRDEVMAILRAPDGD